MRYLMWLCLFVYANSIDATLKKITVRPLIVTAPRESTPHIFEQIIPLTHTETNSVGDIIRLHTSKATLTRYGSPGQLESISFHGISSGNSVILVDGIPLPQTGVSSFNITNMQATATDKLQIETGIDTFLSPVNSNSGILSLGLSSPETSSQTFALEQSNTGESYGQFSMTRSYQTSRWIQSIRGTYTEGLKRKNAQRQWGEENRYKNFHWHGFFEKDMSDSVTINILGRIIESTLHTDLDQLTPDIKPRDRIHSSLKLGRVQLIYTPVNHAVTHTWQIAYVGIDNHYKEKRKTSQRLQQYSGLYTYENRTFKNNTLRLMERFAHENQTFTQTKRQNNQAISITNYYQITQKLGAGLGLRLDRLQPYGTYPSYSAWLNYRFQTNHTISFQYKTSIRFPTLYERYGGRRLLGNPTLKPERSWTAQIGLEQSVLDQKLTLKNALFYTKITHFIHGHQINLNQYERKNKALTAYGWETEIKWQACQSIIIFGQYSLTFFRKPQTVLLLQEGAQHKGVLGLSWQISQQLQAKLQSAYTSKRQSFVFKDKKTSRTWLKGYMVWQATLNYQFTPQSKAYIRIENILNTPHQEVYGYRMPGRGIYVGCHVSF